MKRYSGISLVRLLIFLLIPLIVLCIIQLIRNQTIYLDNIFAFYMRFIPILVFIFILQKIFVKEKDKKVFFMSVPVTLIVLILIIFVINFFIFKVPLWLPSNSSLYLNPQPPQTLNIGGVGKNSVFRWNSNLNTIPDGYYYLRTSIDGYKIYIPRSSSIIQIKKQEQYEQVVVENPGKWISLYSVENLEY